MWEAILQGLYTGFPVLFLHFLVTIIVFACAAYVYFLITPHDEMALIKKGNIAAAISASGALLGMAVPLAVCLAGSVGVIDIIVWGGVILTIQISAYFVIDRLLFRDLSERIRKKEIASILLLLAIKLSVGFISAAAIAV